MKAGDELYVIVCSDGLTVGWDDSGEWHDPGDPSIYDSKEEAERYLAWKNSPKGHKDNPNQPYRLVVYAKVPLAHESSDWVSR